MNINEFELDSSEEENFEPDPLYDSDLDEKDEAWINKKTTNGKEIKTDAILSCPYCFENLCFQCQRYLKPFIFRHEEYDQYRALFVTNCKIITNKKLIYESKDDLNLLKPKFKGLSSLLDNNSFFKVICQTCETDVAVYDNEEVYHFFNVAASLP